MDYIRLMELRKSTRAYRKKAVAEGVLDELRHHFHDARRLVPEIGVGLVFVGSEANEKLDGLAGYNGFMIGAPNYAVLMSDPGEYAAENAGYVGMDLLLKMTDLGLDSCWITFLDAEKVRVALGLPEERQVAGIIAFGYAKRENTVNLDITNTAQVDVNKKIPATPRITVPELVHVGEWEDKTPSTDPTAGFGLSDAPVERMRNSPVYSGFLAVTQAPTYLNRQPYNLIVEDGVVTLVSREDEYTNSFDARLNTGIVMFSFVAALTQRLYAVNWNLGAGPKAYQLPEGHRVEAWLDMNDKPI